MFDEHRLGNDRADPAWTCDLSNGHDEMNEQDDEDAHLGIPATLTMSESWPT
jgi:hypothetical protein